MPEQVQIISTGTVNSPLPNGKILQTVEITYQAVGLPPRRVYVPLEVDSEKARAEAIKADLADARKTGPTLFNVP